MAVAPANRGGCGEDAFGVCCEVDRYRRVALWCLDCRSIDFQQPRGRSVDLTAAAITVVLSD